MEHTVYSAEEIAAARWAWTAWDKPAPIPVFKDDLLNFLHTIETLRNSHDALLEALKAVVDAWDITNYQGVLAKEARAAIAKAEGS